VQETWLVNFCRTKVEFDHDLHTEKQFVDTIDHAKVRVCSVEFFLCKIFYLNAHHVTNIGINHACFL